MSRVIKDKGDTIEDVETIDNNSDNESIDEKKHSMSKGVSIKKKTIDSDNESVLDGSDIDDTNDADDNVDIEDMDQSNDIKDNDTDVTDDSDMEDTDVEIEEDDAVDDMLDDGINTNIYILSDDQGVQVLH